MKLARTILVFAAILLGCNMQARVVKVAASNSSKADKKAADVVCKGVHDELTIQSVLDQFEGDTLTNSIIFAQGNYYIDGFHAHDDADRRTALKIGKCRRVLFQGSEDVSQLGRGSAMFWVRPPAYDDLGADEQVSFLLASKRNGLNKNHVALRNFCLDLPDIHHKVLCIDLYRTGGAQVENLRILAAGRGPGKMPVEGSIGVRAQNVNPNGVGQYWTNIFVAGFYEAFQMGGEHIVAIDLLGYQSYYGYTFGNYELKDHGVWEHPITLINCSEELCASLPLFNKCGCGPDPNNKGLQCVDMISHTMEFRCKENPTLAEVLPAREVVPGTWCGNITFAANRLAMSYENAVDIQFWEKGSGMRFKTRNSAHAVGGTTAERLTYVPTYVQTYYDTDLGKLVIFNGDDWVDANGNKVD